MAALTDELAGCPHCLSAGGVGAVSAGGALAWPEGLHGICGDAHSKDPRQFEAGGAYATGVLGGSWAEGAVVEMHAALTAQHKGRFELRVCRVPAPTNGQTWADAERAALTEACLDAHRLVQADVPGAQAPGQPNWYVPWAGAADPYTPEVVNAGTFVVRYQLPPGLHCDGVSAKCVAQWKYLTGNSCEAPDTPAGFSTAGLSKCGATGAVRTRLRVGK
jgi:hypothetical protein